MPETKYMIVDPRRDHKFQIPRPDLSVKLGIPNPCNRCHEDQSPQWAADKINEWYPATRIKREEEIHFAEIFAAGQANRPEAESGLITIVSDKSRPPIIRATALNILSRFRSQESLDAAASSLKDDNPLVRYEAVKAISTLIPKPMEGAYQKKKYSLLAPLLTDPLRAVRSEAARALTEVPVNLFNPILQEDFELALDEYKERQDSIADRPEAHLNLGIMYENMGQDDRAEASYKIAIKLVNDFSPARFNLANFFNRKGRNTDAEQQFREIIALEPENGEAHYSLGLLLAEMNRLDEAVILMAKAVELMPDRGRVRYNYALALSHRGRNEEALSQMIKAYQVDHRNPEIVQALAIFYMQDNQLKKALYYAKVLVEIAPGDRAPQQMLNQIQQAIENEKKNVE